MTRCSVTIMQDPSTNAAWLAKCYKDGNLDHVEKLSTPAQAQAYADQWLADQVDAEPAN
jgi:hypothetical protein